MADNDNGGSPDKCDCVKCLSDVRAEEILIEVKARLEKRTEILRWLAARGGRASLAMAVDAHGLVPVYLGVFDEALDTHSPEGEATELFLTKFGQALVSS